MSLDRTGASAPPSATRAVTVVPMRRRHLRAVMRIDQQVYPRPWSLGLYHGELNQAEHRRVYVVARVGREVIGHGGFTVVAGEGHITTVAVDPAWHRHGVGTRLMLVLVRAAIDRGLVSMTLEVRATNDPAQRLYRRFGFHEAGVRAGYYAETGEDATIMWAHHLDAPEQRERLDRIEAALVGAPLVDQVRTPQPGSHGGTQR